MSNSGIFGEIYCMNNVKLTDLNAIFPKLIINDCVPDLVSGKISGSSFKFLID
jgi:hypothetical protein